MSKYIKVKNRVNLTNPKDIRRLKLANLIVENPRSLGSAMVKAGYSPQTAVNPAQIIETKSFQALLKEVMPDDFLVSKHKELLNAEVKTSVRGMVTTERIDTDAIARGLDMAYKLKGSYAPDKQIVMNLYQGKQDEEILEEIDRLERELGIKRDREQKV